jgi:hypothetical protein
MMRSTAIWVHDGGCRTPHRHWWRLGRQLVGHSGHAPKIAEAVAALQAEGLLPPYLRPVEPAAETADKSPESYQSQRTAVESIQLVASPGVAGTAEGRPVGSWSTRQTIGAGAGVRQLPKVNRTSPFIRRGVLGRPPSRSIERRMAPRLMCLGRWESLPTNGLLSAPSTGRARCSSPCR